MIEVETEKMSDIFTKYHLKGLPFDAVIHKFTSIAGENAHDHPFSFTSFILKGGYKERIYYTAPDGYSWDYTDVWRLPGTSHRVEADTIHELIELPERECYTIILPEPRTRDTRFWKFDNGIYSRAWNSDEWIKYNG